MKREVIVNHLVTKQHYYDKPTHTTLQQALSDASIRMAKYYPYCDKIAMPLIGCGLDGLKWENVREIVHGVFKNTNYEVVVCKLR
jgi:O-acetyl-ADP-ribose deacetylase (regulator of RNase III)